MLRVAITRCFSTAAAVVKADVGLIARLRKETSLSVSRCKDALLATNNDYGKALAWLAEREQELAQQKAAKVQSRSANEGLVATTTIGSGGCGVIVEVCLDHVVHSTIMPWLMRNLTDWTQVNAETDFAARNEHFRRLVRYAQDAAVSLSGTCPPGGIAHLTSDELACMKVTPDHKSTLAEQVLQTIGLLGEKISVRRGSVLMPTTDGIVGAACLSGLAADLGRVGALVNLSGPNLSPTKMTGFVTQLAQHVAGMHPLALSPTDPTLEHLSEVEIRNAALLSQPFLFQQDMTVRQKLQEMSTSLGLPSDSLQVTHFVRYECGEGIERADKDFAAEVMEQAQRAHK